MLRSTVLATVVTTVLAASLTACVGDDAGESSPTPDPAPTSAAEMDAVSATQPGTALEHGDPATLVWQPASDVVGALELTVEGVQERRASVFDGWVADDSLQAARPYFVRVSLTNVGDDDLAGQAVPLYLRDDRGRLGAPWTVGGDFTPCQSGPLPEPFEAGASAEMCLVYLAPDDARIRDMVFEPTEGYDPIVWTGDVTGPPKVRSRPGR